MRRSSASGDLIARNRAEALAAFARARSARDDDDSGDDGGVEGGESSEVPASTSASGFDRQAPAPTKVVGEDHGELKFPDTADLCAR